MVDAVDPFLPQPIYQYRKSNTKIAPPDIILDEEDISIESMSDYIFDEIGGQELLATARSYTIDSPLSINNLSIENSGVFFDNDIELPSDTLNANLEQYQLNLNDFIPADYFPSEIVRVGPDPVVANKIAGDKNAIIDTSNDNLYIELENLKSNYVIEVRILFGPDTKFATIDIGSD